MRPDAQAEKRVPLRTCIGCRQTRPQRELIRIHVNNNGELELDLGRKRPGRGAYLCPRQECWDKGLRKDKLEHTLKTKVSSETLKQFQQQGTTLLPKLG